MIKIVSCDKNNPMVIQKFKNFLISSIRVSDEEKQLILPKNQKNENDNSDQLGETARDVQAQQPTVSDSEPVHEYTEKEILKKVSESRNQLFDELKC